VTVFGIGTGELLIIAIVALLLFPPHELPKMLRSVAKAWGTVRRTADEFKDAIMQEEAMKEVKDAYHGAKSDLRQAEAEARRQLMKARMEARKAEQKLLAASREREAAARAEEEKKAAELGAGTEGETPAAIAERTDTGAVPSAEPVTVATTPTSASAAAPVPSSEPSRPQVPPPPPTKSASPAFPPPGAPGQSSGSRGQGAA
jgi:sec-independent protein translocase protein TatB